MNKPNNSLFDGKFIMTMVFVMAAWMGWQAYMAKKYPDAYKKPNVASEKSAANPADSSTQNVSTDTATGTEVTKAQPVKSEFSVASEKLTNHTDAVWNFNISSRGMALRDVKLQNYKDRKEEPITFASVEGTTLFATGLSGEREPLDFTVTKTNEHQYVGEAQTDGMKITKILTLEPENYLIKTQVKVENTNNRFLGLVTYLDERIHETKTSFLMPTFDHQEFYVFNDGSENRAMVHHDKTMTENYTNVHIMGYGSQYFAAALIDQSETLPELKVMSLMEPTGPKASGRLTHTQLNKAAFFNLNYSVFVGPKSYELLKTIDADLSGMVNFGFFRSIAKGIFWLMKSIYAAIGNWGIAIICLTILVRILVLPFNVIGYRQMKAMQKIQPHLKTIREKYKNDQQKLNQEMLTLMKEAKANPIGGCLPMFLQIPIFFALYQVIGQSIELYKAPFIFWIHDLSIKDPFYVLPVLMGITMFVQQKITPNTLEPAQQKVMMFLPIFFSFLMISLPSGLTLYIFVSTIFGVLQQLYFMKDDNSSHLTLKKES